ncbi:MULTISPECIES: YaiI/YqxD family protein [Gammaproteobacteria]|uniref:YaiI/YqxD family protein n=1 Tax=Gammaproteobacteria TaxID=1236 RepID=UPI000DCF9F4F|nr:MULTISPECIES: YaiI/YqxD family protein [Gammaproteobacteria]RTE85839.1 YaiI/YqxD family protein [Aliidiomarina sp. B3213]TCZ90160.1 YaiI/YqxD family protein [Lysobacter sp. N42]
MKIYVDADACPVVIKEIIYRAAQRKSIDTYFVANQFLKLPPSKFLHRLQVSAGFDVADNEIVRLAEPGDVVVTADIPLAAEVIDKGASAINPRGELYSKDNIRERLNMRDFMDTMRASGEQTGGPPPLSQKDRHAFAASLDRVLQRA